MKPTPSTQLGSGSSQTTQVPPSTMPAPAAGVSACAHSARVDHAPLGVHPAAFLGSGGPLGEIGRSQASATAAWPRPIEAADRGRSGPSPHVNDQKHGNAGTGESASACTVGDGALDLEKGIVDPRPADACKRWPEGHFLVSMATGVAVLGCCRATNLCDCARHRFIRETTRVLVNDAAVSPPTIFAVLTAREFLRKDESMRQTMAAVVKAVRRRWPAYEHFCRWEDQARGALHANLLVKGVPAEAYEELRQVLVDAWCRRVDADPKAQYAEACDDGEAVTSYVARKVSHAGKRNQEPHLERHKHRTSHTRGYFDRPMAELRAEAARQLQYEALRHFGHSHEGAEHELARRADETWALIRRSPRRVPIDVSMAPPPDRGRSSPASSPTPSARSSDAEDKSGNEETQMHPRTADSEHDGPGNVLLVVETLGGPPDNDPLGSCRHAGLTGTLG